MGHSECSKDRRGSYIAHGFGKAAVCYNHHLDKYHDLLKKGKWNGCSDGKQDKKKSGRMIFTQLRERMVVLCLLICSFII